MVPAVCMAARLSTLFIILILLFCDFCKYASALHVYDRQSLLNINVSYELLLKHSSYRASGLPPPLLLTIHAYLCRTPLKNSHKPQVLFNVLYNLTSPQENVGIVPSSDMCEQFLQFFINKISVIRASFPLLSGVDPAVPPVCPAFFEQFYPVSWSELSKVVQFLRPSHCPLDCLPPRLLKNVFDTVGPFLLRLVNTALSLGCVPSAFKHAVVQPEIKLGPGCTDQFLNCPFCLKFWKTWSVLNCSVILN